MTSRQRERGSGRAAGGLAVTAALLMVTGAILWAGSGADLDAALQDGAVGDYLIDAAGKQLLLSANLALWMVGVAFLAASGLALARLSAARSLLHDLALGCYLVGAALALAAFSVWLGIVGELAPAQAQGTDVTAVAAALGEAASVADWVATVLILAGGQGFVALAGRNEWVPNWLYWWGILLLPVGVAALAGLVLDARTTLTFVIVPLGLGWTLAAGVSLLWRGGQRSQASAVAGDGYG